MNRQTNGNEQSQRTITWVATFLSLALLVASLALALGSGEAVAQRSQTPTLIPAARPTPQGPKKTPEPAQTPSGTNEDLDQGWASELPEVLREG